MKETAWEFRTAVRLKLYDDAIRAKATKGDKGVDPNALWMNPRVML